MIILHNGQVEGRIGAFCGYAALHLLAARLNGRVLVGWHGCSTSTPGSLVLSGLLRHVRLCHSEDFGDSRTALQHFSGPIHAQGLEARVQGQSLDLSGTLALVDEILDVRVDNQQLIDPGSPAIADDGNNH